MTKKEEKILVDEVFNQNKRLKNFKKEDVLPLVEIFTDGSTGKSLDGEMGGGFAISAMNYVNGWQYQSSFTSNSNSTSLMELCAIYQAMVYFINIRSGEDVKCIIYSDSMSNVDGYNKHLTTWKENDWKGPTGIEIKNKSLWEDIYKIREEFGEAIRVEYIAGHSEYPMNELVDSLAVEARSEYKPLR